MKNYGILELTPFDRTHGEARKVFRMTLRVASGLSWVDVREHRDGTVYRVERRTPWLGGGTVYRRMDQDFGTACTGELSTERAANRFRFGQRLV